MMQGAMHSALSDIARDDSKVMVTKWVVVMEIIDENGTPQLWSLNSPGLPMWDQKGMLQFRQEMLIAQPALDEDDE